MVVYYDYDLLTNKTAHDYKNRKCNSIGEVIWSFLEPAHFKPRHGVSTLFCCVSQTTAALRKSRVRKYCISLAFKRNSNPCQRVQSRNHTVCFIRLWSQVKVRLSKNRWRRCVKMSISLNHSTSHNLSVPNVGVESECIWFTACWFQWYCDPRKLVVAWATFAIWGKESI